ncbi:MAG TPA: alanine racemase [Burkholderiaceae bacterium]|nr:alanine racemase [Burkholderiaceae bacterium]
MPRPVEALIHTDALAHNLARARAAAPGARAWAVVKANAYGHGIERAYAGLQGADGFALLDLAEAERIRALGWRGPVLLLEGCFEARDLETCSRLNLWHTVHHEAQIDWLAAHKTREPHRVFLKLNSGMNRLGFRPAAYAHAWRRLSGLTQVESVVLMTHLADADGPRGIAHQLAVFDAATRDLPGERTLANSAAVLRFAPGSEALRADWIRPGVMVYGSSPDFPDHDIAHWGLRPTMSLRAQVIATQTLATGESVGYGSRFTAERALTIGVVACGYADGYPRVAANGTPVLIGDVRTRLVGRVSMDMVTIDLSDAPGAGVGSVATLWGESPGGALLPIDEVAAAAGTIGYELMCALAPRVPTRAVGA